MKMSVTRDYDIVNLDTRFIVSFNREDTLYVIDLLAERDLGITEPTHIDMLDRILCSIQYEVMHRDETILD